MGAPSSAHNLLHLGMQIHAIWIRTKAVVSRPIRAGLPWTQSGILVVTVDTLVALVAHSSQEVETIRPSVPRNRRERHWNGRSTSRRIHHLGMEMWAVRIITLKSLFPHATGFSCSVLCIWIMSEQACIAFSTSTLYRETTHKQSKIMRERREEDGEGGSKCETQTFT